MVFYIMAGVAGLTTVLTLIFGIEPRNIKAKEGLEPEREKHRVAKLHIVKQVFGGVAVSCTPSVVHGQTHTSALTFHSLAVAF